MKNKRNIRLVLVYDGGGYHGWQVQPGVLTIQQVVEDILSRIIQERVRVKAAGRTDAGVHALFQVVNFSTHSGLAPQVLLRALNALLPPDIRVIWSEEVPSSFHSRFSAEAKTYQYCIWNSPVACPFLNRYSWWIPMQLDLEAMRKAASQIIGEHDFVAFKASGSDAKNTVRRVLECGWNESGPMLRFSVKATGFLRYMVRGLVGTMVEIGLGKRPPEDLLQVIESRERSLAGPTAPARGLFLARVFYPPEFSLELEEEGCCGWMEHLVGLKAASPSGL